MRMDVSGWLMILIGAIIVVTLALFEQGRAWWIVLPSTLGLFFGWLFVFSGVSNLLKVREDKKARQRARDRASAGTGVPPSEMHPAIQEPKQ